MEFSAVLNSFGAMHSQFGGMLNALLLIFFRTLGFVFTAPIFNRRDIPFLIKLIFALFLTSAVFGMVPDATMQGPGVSNSLRFLILIGVNLVIGLIIGFIADIILKTIAAAGSMMNNQIGLSSAVIFDPSSRTQVMILDPLFAFLGVLIFIHLGGVFWLVRALKKSFVEFPLFAINQPLTSVIDLSYLVHLSSNVLLEATKLVAPVMIITMSVDIILGMVNRTAQQMPVFQLSFALKPSIGAAILLATLPIMVNAIAAFLETYSLIF
ncbi:MAG: flagellar biosynthetic protein FliR [Vampirovibrio sp.]|nr:flagellar biosynthetic protein FliR [Vampirovibrio sp.]